MKRIIQFNLILNLCILFSFQIKAQSDFTNYQITNSSHNPTETSISMPPGDPSHILVGANTVGIISGTITAGFYNSSDNGNSWNGSDEIKNFSTVDPTVAFSSNGNCFYSFASGNNTSPYYVYVVKSTNNYGTSWEANNTQVSTTNADKPTMFIYNMPNSPNKNNIYIVYSDVSNANNYKIRLSNAVSNSNDPTFSGDIVISGGFDSHAASMAVSPEGYLYVVWSIGNVLNNGNNTEFQTTGLGFCKCTVTNGNITPSSPIQITSVNEIFNSLLTLTKKKFKLHIVIIMGEN
jgi:hypothetical protein